MMETGDSQKGSKQCPTKQQEQGWECVEVKLGLVLAIVKVRLELV